VRHIHLGFNISGTKERF